MKPKKPINFGATILTLDLTTMADYFVSGLSCSKPYNPYQFNSELELKNFKDEVREYKECIMDFVDEQNEAVAT